MAAVDPLSLLREYNINRREVVEKDDRVYFDNIFFPKTAKTNYRVYRSGKEPKDYYTLESLLFLLKHVSLSHPLYVQKAVSEKIPVVRLPDRRGLLRYLGGDIDTSASIDRGAHLALGVQTSEAPGAASANKRPSLDFGGPDAKRRPGADSAADSTATDLRPSDRGTTLKDAMSMERIAAIKAKRLQRKRGIVGKGDDEMPGTTVQRTFGTESDLDVKDILAKERLARTRATVLQSSGKVFSNVLTILQVVRAREESDTKKQESAHSQAPVPRKPQQVGYNRYGQEQFKAKHETEGFKIDTLGSYHGMSLQSVTEGQESRHPTLTPGPSVHRSSQRVTNGGVPRPPHQPRQSRTPIIVIPGTTTSLITMFNCKELLQDLKFVTTDEKKRNGARRENEFLVQRTRPNTSGTGGSTITIPYRITDNVSKFTESEWQRVVAVFVQGPAWQFKGWPWLGDDGSPVNIFSKVKAFHLKYDHTKLDKNVQKWDVTVLELSESRRHLDRPTFMRFWEILDRFTAKHMSHLRL